MADSRCPWHSGPAAARPARQRLADHHDSSAWGGPDGVPRQSDLAGRSHQAHGSSSLLGTKIRGMRTRRISFRACLVPVLLVLLVASACGPTVDLTKALEVQDVSTGWLDVGPADGQNKL